MGICTTFTCFQTLRPRKRALYTKQDSYESKEPRFRLLEIEANAVIYIHPKYISNEPGFWRRQSRLVTNATEISLLRSLVASQQ